MILDHVNTLLALMPPQSQPGQQPDPSGQLVQMLVTFGLLGVIFYFIAIRPQQKKQKQHTVLLKSLRAGDKIVTTGGIVGTVISVKDKTINLRSADTKMEVLKSAVGDITERGAESGAA